jgi:hypothetical protein
VSASGTLVPDTGFSCFSCSGVMPARNEFCLNCCPMWCRDNPVPSFAMHNKRNAGSLAPRIDIEGNCLRVSSFGLAQDDG